MSLVRRGKCKAQCVHDKTVVRSHSAVLVAVEIEWARRLSGGGKLRSPSETLGKTRLVAVVLRCCGYAGRADALMLSRCRRRMEDGEWEAARRGGRGLC